MMEDAEYPCRRYRKYDVTGTALEGFEVSLHTVRTRNGRVSFRIDDLLFIAGVTASGEERSETAARLLVQALNSISPIYTINIK